MANNGSGECAASSSSSSSSSSSPLSSLSSPHQQHQATTVYNGDITFAQQIVASSVGALLTSLVVTPMDVVKIRLQSQVRPLAEGDCFLFSNGLMDHLCRVCGNRAVGIIGRGGEQCEWFNRPGHFNGTLDAFVKIVRFEGLRSLWSGLSPTMLSAIPATVFYFTLYDNLLCMLRNALVATPTWAPMAPLLAGTMARTVAVSVVSPLELVRTKMQSERLSYDDLRRAIVRTVKADGYAALWRGWTATIMRDIPFSALYWTLYEHSKQRFVQLAQRQRTNFALSFASGALAGSVAALLTLPFDVVKTQQQITLGQLDMGMMRHAAGAKSDGVHTAEQQQQQQQQQHAHRGDRAARMSKPNNTMFSVMRELVNSKGVGVLFTGAVPRVARVAPACAVMIGSYEELKQFFARKNSKTLPQQ